MATPRYEMVLLQQYFVMVIQFSNLYIYSPSKAHIDPYFPYFLVHGILFIITPLVRSVPVWFNIWLSRDNSRKP